jgi:hypothetical protein
MTAVSATRLLLAARQAYAITGSTAADSVGADRIGWLRPPAALSIGANAALMGDVPEGVIVAFRGTQPPGDPGSLADWMEDIDALPVIDPFYPGRVHAGFRDAVAPFWGALVPSLPLCQIYVTGHSLGGAMAQLFAYRAAPRAPIVVTFAAPRCGDAAFVAAVDAKLHINRYENARDVVPTLPPVGYLPAGVPHAIWDGHLLDAYPPGWGARIMRGLIEGAAIAAHSIDPGSAYAAALGA